ncbi:MULTISPECIES: RNA polymerase sigma factor [unclassified Nesterenkonia]|uniref:RNA polymerase sigma factor n=1 Tax=unclassified Nesterenkonia TaxID=2629769 RepID=UPI001F4CF400|nr:MULTISPECIES: sigma-70 family RNA polymerase sigma factor [unclassified Nesterenkonia]MCH8559734.1 sigma-70 family RNA polymerase sigma factor [Nesterenkonia sp. DZ6]MCH8561898.1 sigma-70 family RNA polymerase sigma factor [Nesterenkonia sp. YGD6]
MQAEDDTELDVRDAFAAHGGALFSFARKALGDRAEAEDCVQEAFIRAWRNRDLYRSERGSVRTWLFAITRNLIIDSLRARARRPAPSDPEKMQWPSEQVTEDILIVERLVLYEALATLTYEHRQVIAAVQLNGVGYSELSAQTGVPVATLRTRMYYGLRSLRTALGGHAREEGDAFAAGGADDVARAYD